MRRRQSHRNGRHRDDTYVRLRDSGLIAGVAQFLYDEPLNSTSAWLSSAEVRSTSSGQPLCQEQGAASGTGHGRDQGTRNGLDGHWAQEGIHTPPCGFTAKDETLNEKNGSTRLGRDF